MGKYRDRRFTPEELDEIISQMEIESKQYREKMEKEREQIVRESKRRDCHLFLLEFIEFCRKIANQDYGKENYN